MFKPVSERIKQLAEKYPEKIQELERVFDKKTNVYIDYANVRGWSQRLGWRVDIKRLKQFFNSFDNINQIKFYYGTIKGKPESEMTISNAQKLGYIVKTKPVKIMKLSIDISSIASDSIDILKNFIRPTLLSKLNIEIVKSLNNELRTLNQQGILYLEDSKANFDVEIGRDMFNDYDVECPDNFMLWSGDSDFEDPIRQLLKDKIKVILCATSKRIATELNMLRSEGLIILDVQKIKEFICYKKDITQSKGDPLRGPQALDN